MNLNPKKVREIYEFAPLHDIGKVRIPDSILRRSGRLDPSEWKIMRAHVTLGAKIVENFQKDARSMVRESSLETMKNITADHHEWWNGRGYAHCKKREEISIEERIIALVDVFMH